jgi:hypothetical protein
VTEAADPPSLKDTEQLVRAVRLLDHAAALLGEARAAHDRTPDRDPLSQQGNGLSSLCHGVSEAINEFAAVIGFARAGLEDRVESRLRAARWLGLLPIGTDRLKRPLEPSVAAALLLIRQVAEVYRPEAASRITKELAATEPSWPPPELTERLREALGD